MSRPPGPCPPDAPRLASQCPASLISWSGHRSGGGGQGWPFRPAWPSGRKCGHQSRASTPGDVLPPACLSETSVTAAPGHCQGHLATTFRSTSELSPPLSPHLVTLLPCFQHPSVAPKRPQCKCLQVGTESPCQPLWQPCPWCTLFPSLWPAVFTSQSQTLPTLGPSWDMILRPAVSSAPAPTCWLLAVLWDSCFFPSERSPRYPPPLHSAGNQECISDLAGPGTGPACGPAPGAGPLTWCSPSPP